MKQDAYASSTWSNRKAHEAYRGGATFFDVRKRVCVDALNHLRQTFGNRALPPVRINTRLAEAPGVKKTIFEHAPDSNGAADYLRVVEWIRSTEGAASMTRAA